MPGNKTIAAAIGCSLTGLSALLSILRTDGAIDYEWRPAPSPDDETLQKRFVTRA